MVGKELPGHGAVGRFQGNRLGSVFAELGGGASLVGVGQSQAGQSVNSRWGQSEIAGLMVNSRGR